ncbi:MAG: ComEC/Rec2 family competence protein [Bacteroidales bacterium]
MIIPSNIHEVPFFRLLIPFVAGILGQSIFAISSSEFAFALLPLILFIVLAIGSYWSHQWKFRWIFGVILSVFLFTCGLVLTVNWSYSNVLTPQKNYSAILRLVENPQHRTRSIRATCSVEKLLVDQSYVDTQEDILVYFSSVDSLANNLRYGDIIATNITVQEFEKPMNPNQFDVGQYMQLQRIRFSTFIKQDGWMLLGNRSNCIVRISLQLRNYFLQQFGRYSIEGDQLAVLSALTLGYKDLLDDELRKVYSSTGAMHILAVSGLHVGILYFLLATLLFFVPSSKFTRFVKLIVLLGFLWFYALLTGLSPSVCRSALMFSVVAIGQCFNTRSNIFNTLAVAAFILLVVNPLNLYSVGFQLSFMAVLSIVVFFPYIHRLIYCKGKASNYIWSLVAVSVAAQIGTFPITATYFGQFPTYFLITNIIAIPLATIILYFSVLLLTVSSFPVIASFVGLFVNLLLKLLNGGLQWIENIPGALIAGIHISQLQLFLLIIGIVLIVLFMHSRRALYLLMMLAGVIIVFVINIHKNLELFSDEFVAFSMPRNSVVCIRKNGVANFIGIDSISNKNLMSTNAFYLSGYVSQQTVDGCYACYGINSRIDSVELSHLGISLKKAYGMAIVKSDSLVVALPYNDSLRVVTSRDKFDVDVLFVNWYFSENILDFIKPKMVVIDASVSKRKLDKLMVLFIEQKIRFHNLATDGAYQLKIE